LLLWRHPDVEIRAQAFARDPSDAFYLDHVLGWESLPFLDCRVREVELPGEGAHSTSPFDCQPQAFVHLDLESFSLDNGV
jgi:hypothetical protein